MLSLPQMECAKCKKSPRELEEYLLAAEEEEMSPEQYCFEEEGTLDEVTGKFLCTVCYIEVGMPSLRNSRWIATPDRLKELGL